MSDPRDEGGEAADGLRLTAYCLVDVADADRIVPAPPVRDWMRTGMSRQARLCLPLLMASQAGWLVLNRTGFRATWNGGSERRDVMLEGPDGGDPPADVSSHFGDGIITIVVPFLFRTPPGFALLARGPANMPKDGVSPLEGLVETDWSVAPFMMNWKLTRPHQSVVFAESEPVCMLVPQRLDDLERFRPAARSLESEPELRAQYRAFFEERVVHQAFVRAACILAGAEHPDARRPEGHYMRGTSPGGASAGEHRTRLRLQPFASELRTVEGQ